jgi:hypothetical protein
MIPHFGQSCRQRLTESFLGMQQQQRLRALQLHDELLQAAESSMVG